MFRIGQRVQAVDEIGRWELGRVISVESDGRPTVKFVGWDDNYNVQPVEDEVRLPVDFQSHYSVPDQPKRQERKATRSQLALLRRLCRGDFIQVDGHDGLAEVEVLQVDQFMRKVKVLNAGSIRDIDVNSIYVAEEQDPNPVANTKRARNSHQNRRPTSVEGHNDEDLRTCEEAVSEPQTHKGFFEVPTRYGPIRCGMICQVLTKPLVVVVKEITFDGSGFFCNCWLVAEGVSSEIDRDISLTIPVNLLKPFRDCPPLGRDARKIATAIAKLQLETCLCQLREDFSFRRLVRCNSLKCMIGKEIASVFKSKNQRKTFSFGICCPEIDFGVFGVHLLSRKRAVFSYKDNTIQELDELMGSGWDWEETGGHTPFVTQLVFWLRNDCIHGTVYSAIFPGPLGSSSYREAFARYIKDAQLPFPVEEPSAEENE